MTDEVRVLRLLTPEARKRRFDFEWRVQGARLPLLAIIQAEVALKHALETFVDSTPWRKL